MLIMDLFRPSVIAVIVSLAVFLGVNTTCSTGPRQFQDVPEYIIKADGPWCPYVGDLPVSSECPAGGYSAGVFAVFVENNKLVVI